MFEKISQVFAKAPTEVGYRLYDRGDKPAALQGWIFTDELLPLVGSVLSDCGLSWIFESTRTGPPVQIEESTAPEHRERTPLTAASTPLLLADLVERNLHGFRRFVALYGGDARLLELTGDEELHEAVEAFAEGLDSPMRILIVQYGDVAPDFIYFRPGKEPTVDALLSALRIPPLTQIVRARYRDLKGEELETAISYLSCAEHDH